MRTKEPRVLRGLTGVEILVEGLRDSSLVDLDNETVREDMSGVLTATSIELLPAESGGAVLYLNVDLLPGKRGCDLVAGLELQLLEDVRRERDPETRVLASTWDDGVVLASEAGDVAYVRNAVRSLVSRFVDAWQSANASS